MDDQSQGFRITKCCPSVVRSMHRHDGTCFRDSPPLQCAVGVPPTNALPWGLGSAVQWVCVLQCGAVGDGGGGGQHI